MRLINYLISKTKNVFKNVFNLSSATPEISSEAQVVNSKTETRDDDVKLATSGSFYFKENILDQLDEYFEYMKSLKKIDPDGFHIFSSMGVSMASRSLIIDRKPNSRWLRGSRPSFSAISLLAIGEDDESHFGVKISYICKVERRPESVQPHTGVMYAVTVYWADRKDKNIRIKNGHAFRFYIGINNDCTTTLLKEKKIKYHQIKSKKSGTISIPQITWSYPEEFYYLSGQKNETPQEYANDIFWIAANFSDQNNMGLRISAFKDNITAAFNVDMLRTPYFFKDRSTVTTKNGSKKKIFHIVRPHTRVNADGSNTHVKTHFRGEREFNWNGYSIIISMPGYHHRDFNNMDFGVLNYDESEEIPRKRGIINAEKFGKVLLSELRNDRSTEWRKKRQKHLEQAK